MTRTGRHVLFASLAAAGVGVYRLGLGSREWPPDGAPMTDVIVAGAAIWLPALILALIVSRFWAEIFARMRQRPLDQDWLPMAWLFALMLPAATPLGLAALSLSFGLVFGCHVFGGSGRYLVHPALVGVVFLTLSYPDQPAASGWQPNGDTGASMELYVLACLLGAGYLLAVRVASIAIIGGGLLGLTIAALVAGDSVWSSQLAAGHFAFALAFLAVDPTTSPRTISARWVFGLLFGALTLTLRTANPDHPEGSLEALLLASLCVPLLDRVASFLPSGRRQVSDA